MKFMLIVGLVVAMAGTLPAQEGEEVPKDSDLVSIRGCARDRNFIVAPRTEDQPGTLEIEPGRRFRLNGPKKLLDEIKARQRTIIEVTGLIRKADLTQPGVGILGGRVRIGGGMPQSPVSDPTRDPSYNQAVIDVRSYRVMTGDCPAR
jgi:hypothetical protein